MIEAGITIMKAEQVVRDLFDALEKQQYARALGYISDEFVQVGAWPRPINKYQWIATLQALARAMPDLSLGARGIHGRGDTVYVTLSVSGTHSGDLQFPTPGSPLVHATDKQIALPCERAILKIKGGQVVAFRTERVLGGGIPGILQQIGKSRRHH
jgi:hypothetical protein